MTAITEENQKLRTLSVNFDEAVAQLERPDLSQSRVCFDTSEGKIEVIPQEVMRAVESGDVESIAAFPEWRMDLVETAENVLFYEKDRYLEIPASLLLKMGEIMKAFAATVDDEPLKDRLQGLIDSGAGVEDFEKALFEHPSVEDKWFDFREESMRKDITVWLNSMGIEPLPDE